MRFITIVEVIRCTPGKGAEFLIAQRLVGGQVGGGDADQVIGVAEQPFGVADLWDADQATLEFGDRGGIFAVHGDVCEYFEAEANGGGVELRENPLPGDGVTVVGHHGRSAPCRAERLPRPLLPRG